MPQRRLRLHSQLPREVGDREQQVAHLLLDLPPARPPRRPRRPTARPPRAVRPPPPRSSPGRRPGAPSRSRPPPPACSSRARAAAPGATSGRRPGSSSASRSSGEAVRSRAFASSHRPSTSSALFARAASPNTCGWRRTSLSVIDASESATAELAGLRAELRQQHALEDQVADLLAERRAVARVDRLQHLVGLLEHEGPQRLQRLLAVPRAAVRRAQARDDVDEAVEGGAGGVGHGRMLPSRVCHAGHAPDHVQPVRPVAVGERRDPPGPAAAARQRQAGAPNLGGRAPHRGDRDAEGEDRRQPRRVEEQLSTPSSTTFACATSRPPAARSEWSSLERVAGRVTFLGTGTSHGVPMIGCRCAVCTSADPRDQRLRPSIYVELANGGAFVVDTAPDFRTQALRFGVLRVDAVLFTHPHADHLLGLDEIRRFNALQRAVVPCYGNPETIVEVRRVFAYAFEPRQAGGGVPQLELRAVTRPVRGGRHDGDAGAGDARRAANPRLPCGDVRLSDRLQRDSRTSRGRCSTASARWSWARSGTGRTRRTSPWRRRSRWWRGSAPSARCSRTSRTTSATRRPRAISRPASSWHMMV